jgi:hypothetical protein
MKCNASGAIRDGRMQGIAIVRRVWQNGGDLGDLTQKPAENALF